MKNKHYPLAVFLILLIMGCTEAETWDSVLQKAQSNAILTMSYQQTVRTYKEFPGQSYESLPSYLQTQTIPIVNKEKMQISLRRDGSIEVFTEILEVEESGFLNESFEDPSIKEETKYIHMVNGVANFYDRTRTLIETIPLDLGDHTDIVIQLVDNKQNINAITNGLATGNPFFWQLLKEENGKIDTPNGSLNGRPLLIGYETLENQYYDDGTNSYQTQEADMNTSDRTIEQIRDYNAQGTQTSVARLLYDKSGSQPKLIFMEEISLEQVGENSAFYLHSSTEFEGLTVDLNF